jgi:hypothetical protein
LGLGAHVNQPQQLSDDYGIRRRAVYDSLNEFFGEKVTVPSATPDDLNYGHPRAPINQSQQLSDDYRIRKRPAYDAFNEFFGDAKRRSVDPNTYHDVEQRFKGLWS